jgi:hypothetical protein
MRRVREVGPRLLTSFNARVLNAKEGLKRVIGEERAEEGAIVAISS